MKQNIFEPGDEVRFLDEIGSAVVVRNLYDGMVLVRTDDDFEYPVHPGQLILIKKNTKTASEIATERVVTPHTGSKTNTIGKAADVKKTASEINTVEHNLNEKLRISLAFTPVLPNDPVNGDLLMHIVNDSGYELLFQVLKQDDTGIRTIAKGNADPGFIEDLFLFNREGLNQLKKITVQLIFCGKFGMLQRSPIERHYKPDPVCFFTSGNYAANSYFDTKALLWDIINEQEPDAATVEKIHKLADLLSEKEAPPENKAEKYAAREKPKTIEVDLHINAILDDCKGLSNAEILDYQMQHFHKSLTDAMFEKAQKVVFIHGIGNGTLRDKVRESLKTQYHLNFQDASFQEFGFGATLVFLSGKQL